MDESCWFSGIENLKTIRVTDETHIELLRITGTLQAKEGKKKTAEDAIEFLLEEYGRNKERKQEESAISGWNSASSKVDIV